MARTRVGATKPFRAGKDERMQALAAVAKTFEGFRPAPEVLRRVEAVPTIFPQYDYVTGVKGHPISRFALLHGPSNHGKTTFGLGLGKSFLARHHFFGLADAERTTPPEWVASLYGDLMRSPGFVALPVSTYEKAVDGVRDFCTKVGDARAKGQIPEDTTGLILVDSIRKLVPKNLMDTLMKEGSEGGKKSKGVDGFGGRAGQIKAALNAAWVDELIPLLADTRMAMVVIARETKDPDAGMYDEGIKVGGGTALYYEASLDLRVTHQYIRDKDEHERIFGERHMVQIRKTKVAAKDVSIPKAWFHTSNGTQDGIPAGFDVARDLLELGQKTGIVELKGSWYGYDTGEQSGKLGNGETAAVRHLYQNPAVLADLEAAIRDVAMPQENTQE